MSDEGVADGEPVPHNETMLHVFGPEGRTISFQRGGHNQGVPPGETVFCQ